MRNVRFLLAIASVVFVGSVASALAEETFGQKLLSAAASSAGSKGGEFAFKFAAGWIYNISCKPEQQTDEGSKALCGALGSLSGKSEEEWKAKIESRLNEISGKLDAIASGQERIATLITQQHKSMNDQFKQLPNAVKVTDILTTIDNFWGRFQAEVKNPKSEMNKIDLEKFAQDVTKSNLHLKLGELNSLLTRPIDNAQPLLRYPFYQFRQSWSQEAPPEAFPGMTTYDFAEKKFAYYRGEQQKGYIVYLWAAEIIQSDCEIRHDEKCGALPITSTAFVREYERFTREQVEAFDAAANGMILAYSRPESDDPRFFLKNSNVEPILMRINYLTSVYLGDGKGAWGEVISTEGDPWDGRITMQCNGQRSMTPTLSYAVAADTRFGPSVDWWSSRGQNGTYDEVRFASRWKVHHYKFEEGAPGPCAIEAKGLPWVSQNSEITQVTKDGATFPFGFFYGIQRAGGTYAMASGQNWEIPTPQHDVSGDASRKDDTFKWLGSKFHHESLWAGILDVARVEHSLGKTLTPTQDLKLKTRVYAYNRKSIFFPEGGTVKVRMAPHNLCDTLCRSGLSVEQGILDYDVENSPYEKGKLTAIVAVFLDPTEGYNDQIFDRARNGIFLDGSYGETNDRKTMRIQTDVNGAAKVNPGQAYHLEYLVYFDLLTHTKRLDATSYRLLGKITPYNLFVTR